MRASRVEALSEVAFANTREELVEFLGEQHVGHYRDDDRWNKVYRKGGPLEWFNPPFRLEVAFVRRNLDNLDPGLHDARKEPCAYPNDVHGEHDHNACLDAVAETSEPNTRPMTIDPRAYGPAAIRSMARAVHEVLGKSGRDRLSMGHLLTLNCCMNLVVDKEGA
jgi:hypothetical protein